MLEQCSRDSNITQTKTEFGSGFRLGYIIIGTNVMSGTGLEFGSVYITIAMNEIKGIRRCATRELEGETKGKRERTNNVCI